MNLTVKTVNMAFNESRKQKQSDKIDLLDFRILSFQDRERGIKLGTYLVPHTEKNLELYHFKNASAFIHHLYTIDAIQLEPETSLIAIQ